jgi:hypothetical protein
MSANRDDRNRQGLLDFMVNSVPRLEAPPFFAARVANLAQVERHSFARSLQAFSRRLVPVFAALVMVVCFAAYKLATPDPLLESAMFYDEEHLSETISLEYVALLHDEENEN